MLSVLTIIILNRLFFQFLLLPEQLQPELLAVIEMNHMAIKEKNKPNQLNKTKNHKTNKQTQS